jgi:UDP-N-acetylmuramoyl-L-alanyl-D-glutamate--2,6-diaminopimelate ligase
MHITSPWGEGHISNQLLGRFNASNLLAAFAVLLVLKQPFADVMQKLSSVNTVAGRMERFGDEAQPMVVVDYAHTPDALEQVLQALREHCRHKLWCVFGCGGNRDTSKRPLMGEIAVRFADQIVITDDNPRHEDGDQIVADIVAGIKEQETIKVMRDRREAIDYAISNAQTDDVVLIAGKGHEDYQLVGDESLPFSDSKLVDEVLGKVKG